MGWMLEAKNLSAGYDAKFLLKGINAAVRRGELAGVIGPNGSGKTTFLRAVSRILRPETGEILLEGKDIWRMRPKELARRMAFVSQTVDLDFNMSVKEFVLLGRIPHFERFQLLESERDDNAAETAMSLTGILHLKERRVNELSGGERQLVAICRALAQEPKLLLLDEPTAHLDISHQITVLEVVKKLNKDAGLTVIMVLHDLNLASEYCDKLMLFSQGVIRTTGSVQEVLRCETLGEVYETAIVLGRNPVSQKPHVFLVAPGAQGGP